MCPLTSPRYFLFMEGTFIIARRSKYPTSRENNRVTDLNFTEGPLPFRNSDPATFTEPPANPGQAAREDCELLLI